MAGSPLEEIIITLGSDIYETNAFRLLGVPTDTSPRQLKRKLEKIRLEAKFNHHGGAEVEKGSSEDRGEDQSETTPEDDAGNIGKARKAIAGLKRKLEEIQQNVKSDNRNRSAVEDGPIDDRDEGQEEVDSIDRRTIENAKKAVERLNDPYQRLVEEFFWFWSDCSHSQWPDHAVGCALRGEVEEADRYWQKRVESGDAIALHNLAVLHHMAALEYDLKLDHYQLGKRELKSLHEHWEKAHAFWGRCLAHEAIWKRVEGRVQALDDRRLYDDVVEDLRLYFPKGIVLIAGKRAILCMENGEEECALEHAERIDRLPFSDALKDEAKTMAIVPIRERVDIIVRNLNQEKEDDPVHVNAVVEQVLHNDVLKRDLGIVKHLFGPKHSTTLQLHDEINRALTNAILAYGNKVEDWPGVKRMLDKVLRYAVSDSQRKRIRSEREKAEEKATSWYRWAVPGYYELPEDLLSQLEQAKGLFERLDLDAAIGILNRLYEKWTGKRAYIARPLSSALYLRAMTKFRLVTRKMEQIARQPSFRMWGPDARTRASIQAEMKSIGKDLAQAVELHPASKTTREEYQRFKGIASKMNLNIPLHSTLKYAPPIPPAAEVKITRSSSPIREKMKSAGYLEEMRSNRRWAIGVGLFILLAVMILSVVPRKRIVYAYVTQTPTPNSTPSPFPPTLTPTLDESLSSRPPENCVRWDEIDASNVGNPICMYGIAQEVIPSNGVFTITFSEDPSDVKVRDYNFFEYDVAPGDCVLVYGQVRDNVSYLFVAPDVNNPERIERFLPASSCE